MKLAGFDLVFKPRSICIVGASNTPGTVGKAVMDNLIWGGFEGKIYPVNIKPVSFPNLKSYPSAAAIDEAVDLAIIIVPAVAVLQVMQQVAHANIKAVVIISAGFREMGGEGAKREAELAQFCTKHDIILIGPNCLGVINPYSSLNASFAGSGADKGHIAFVSQSGALCTAVLDTAQAYGLGFSKFVSIGNKATLHELDLLEYLAADDQTAVILIYLEQLSHYHNWVGAVQRITHASTRAKPIIALKAGRTQIGAYAALSHTGSLAGDDDAYVAFFRQAGIVRAESIEDMFDMASVFSRMAPPKKSGVAIVTNAGGPGIIAADAAEMNHLILSQFAHTTTKALQKILPPTANIHNPLDLVGDADAERYKDALTLIGQDPNVGSVLVVLTPQAMTDSIQSATAIVEIRKQFPKLAFVACFMGGEMVRSGIKVLQRAGIPVIAYPDRAAASLASLIHYAEWLYKPLPQVLSHQSGAKEVQKLLQHLPKEQPTYLDQEIVWRVLSAYGFPIATSGLAKSSAQALSIAHDIANPVALKVISPEIVHKTEVGGVRLNVTEAEVAQEYESLLHEVRQKAKGKAVSGVLVQEMASLGQEVILGAKRDPVFGPLVLFGIGGIYVEVIRDIVMRLAPISLPEAVQMTANIRSAALLRGFRGHPALDTAAIALNIVRLSDLMINHPEIAEVDINPLIARPRGKGVLVLDARIVVQSTD